MEDAPLFNKPRSVESPESVKYCKHILERNQEQENATYEWQKYDRHHILQLLRQRNCQTSLSGDNEPSQERTKDSVHPDNVREECRAKEDHHGDGHEEERRAAFDGPRRPG